jgi:hypothetical protein
MRFLAMAALAFVLAAEVVAEAAERADDSVAQFEKKAKDYAAARKRLSRELPSIGDKASSEEIAAHKAQLRELLRTSRPNAPRGYIICAGIFFILSAGRSERAGAGGRNAADAILKEGNPAAEGKPFVPKINAQYPENAPRSTVPPDLLAKLPSLPEGLEYRFVGRTLILYDAEADLIVDYISAAVHEGEK